MKAYGVERGYYLESDFTEPRPDCPRPERWHSADPDSTELEVLDMVAGFVSGLQPDIVVETGTAFGDGAVAIGNVMKRNPYGHLFTLEPDVERAEFARSRMDGLPVTVIEAESLSWEPPGDIGFAWFDSLIELRIQELVHFSPWLPIGSIVGFHDCGPHRSDFRMRLEALAGMNLLRLIMPRTPRGVCFAEIRGRVG